MDGKLKPKDLKATCTRAALRHWVRCGLLPNSREKHNTQEYLALPAELLPRIERIAQLRRMGLSCMGIQKYFAELEAKKCLSAQNPPIASPCIITAGSTGERK